MARVLVVGASGILAPAAAELVARGDPVTGVGRTTPMPTGVEPVHVDATDADALACALIGRWDAVVAYQPATSDASLEVLRARAPRLVLVRTSAAAHPSLGDVRIAPDTLLLGWIADDAGSRWHDARAVSAAALEVLDDGAGSVLGTVRPWGDRP